MRWANWLARLFDLALLLIGAVGGAWFVGPWLGGGPGDYLLGGVIGLVVVFGGVKVGGLL